MLEEWFKLNSKSSVEESRQPEADLLVEDSDCCIILDSPLPKYKNTHNMESETLVIIDPINKLEDENLLSECEKVIGKLEDPNLTINTSSETITKNIFMDNKDLNYRKHQYLSKVIFIFIKYSNSLLRNSNFGIVKSISIVQLCYSLIVLFLEIFLRLYFSLFSRSAAN
jgi:hypothetical protein